MGTRCLVVATFAACLALGCSGGPSTNAEGTEGSPAASASSSSGGSRQGQPTENVCTRAANDLLQRCNNGDPSIVATSDAMCTARRACIAECALGAACSAFVAACVKSPTCLALPDTPAESGSSGNATSSSGGSSGSSGSQPSSHPECASFGAACGDPPGSPGYSAGVCEDAFWSCQAQGHAGTPAYVTCVIKHACDPQKCARLADNCTGPVP